MISIDKNSNIPVYEQVVARIRYLVASGHFPLDQPLPSTRDLAEQTGLSFHTIRRAYQKLETEGILEARSGSGYWIRQRAPYSKIERMERGAVIVHDVLQQLIGLGLLSNDIDVLVQEQLERLETGQIRKKVIFVAPYQEMADLCAAQMSDTLQRPVDAVSLAHVDRHRDAEYVMCPFSTLLSVMTRLPQADTTGVNVHLNSDAMEETCRLLPTQTVAVIARESATIPHLMAAIRQETGYSGQMIASTIDEKHLDLRQIVHAADLLLYTPGCKRRLKNLLQDEMHHFVVTPMVSTDSVDLIRQRVPS